MSLSLIVAHDTKRAIGKDGKIPWYIPDDLQFFKTITTGKTVVMGRKTFENIGKPLPNRTNIVLTSNPERMHPDIIQISKPEFVMDYAKDKEVFIIGGGEIYSQFINLCNLLYVTEIDEEIGGDTFFPPIREDIFSLASSWPNTYTDKDGHVYDYKIKVYTR